MTNFLPKLEHSETKFPADFFHLLDHIVSLFVHQVNRKIAICKIVWQKWQPDLEMKTHTLVCGHPPPVPFVAVHMDGSDISLRWCSWIVG